MIKQLLTPFGKTSKNARILTISFWFIFFIIFFEISHSKLIPSPLKIMDSLVTMVQTRDFYENLMSSLFTTLKSMFFSIVITVIIVYASTIPLFNPLAHFISKCRYLTLTGLVFVFNLLSNNFEQLKISLLVFGIVPFFVTSFLSVVESTPIEQKYKGYVNGLGRWGTLYQVIVIGKLDILFEVMRQNFAISWMMITMVEGYAMSEGGIGTMMIKSNKYLDLAPVFSMLIVVLVLGLTFDYVLSILRETLFPYIKTKK